MKTRHFILFGLIAIAFTACNLSGTVNNTPKIIFVTNPITNKTDTLNSYYTDASGVYRMDTIQVGDTVNFHILLYGYSNNLTSYTITLNDTASTGILLPGINSLDSIFSTTSSNYSDGKFVFKSKISSLYFPFRYIAKKATTTATISLMLSSDADFTGSNSVSGSNSISFVLRTPIVQAKQTSVLQ